jgi:hypothetical protein
MAVADGEPLEPGVPTLATPGPAEPCEQPLATTAVGLAAADVGGPWPLLCSCRCLRNRGVLLPESVVGGGG